MKKNSIFFLLILFCFSGFSFEKRDVLQTKAKNIELEKVLIKNFSELNFPTYKGQSFKDNLPSDL